ncbi:MAG: S41 family peptidase [Pseudomonadota bacterium]
MLKFAFAASAAALFAASATADTQLLRFPDIHGDQVAFSYGGDIWIASTEGGSARRVTSHPGVELFPKFSPDGSSIAFTGQYGGDEQVFVVPSAGGEARQLTYYPAAGPLPARWGYDNQVQGWSPDGASIVFRSLRDGATLTDGRLYTVPVDGGLPDALPMTISGAGVLSPDGTQALFSPLMRDFRTWKRYEGGWAQDLFIFDLDGSGSVNITDHPRTDRDPMWIGDTVYFVSDRDDYLNIYAYDPESAETTQITTHEGTDVRWPGDDGESRIVYELGGSLRILDLESGEDTAIEIFVGDDDSLTRARVMDASGDVRGYSLSPDGVRLAVAARGDAFSVPVEDGVTRNLTATTAAHEREVAWSPKGDLIAYISDETGEEQLWVRDARGESPPRQVTEDLNRRIYNPVWSPDGSKIALGDTEAHILVVDVESGQVQEAFDDAGFHSHDYDWSPDSRYLAFAAQEPDARGLSFRSLHIWDSEDGGSEQVTGPMFSEYNPRWSADGEHLFFLSRREFAPLIDTLEWNYAQNRGVGVFALALNEESPNPFLPKNAEVKVEADENDDDAEDENGDEETVSVEIDFDGLSDRLIRAPIDADNIFSLALTEGHILTYHGGAFHYGRSSGVENVLRAYSIENRKSFDVAEGLGGYSLAADEALVAIWKNGAIHRLKITEGDKDLKTVSLSDVETRMVPSEEYAQIFDETWRRFRDYFYVENMHGYDWEALREQYRPLVNDVAHRDDLNYLIGEMIGELNAGHAYKAGGQMGAPARPNTALLGARLELDERSGRYRFAEIFDGEAAEPKYRSPLNEVGIDVEEGDFLLAVNGRTLGRTDNVYALLQGLGDGLVELTVSDRANGNDPRRVIIDPLTSEDDLLYHRWVERNRARVEEATDGRLGYMHIPDMGADGIYEFNRQYYGQIAKEGLIVDVRQNGGGNVSQMLINRLDRQLIFTGYARGLDITDTYPNAVFVGPMAAILDEDSASDGDIFPAAFKARGLGPLIGKRSWGGVIGITSHGPLMDGGSVFVPQFGFADDQGNWTIEGVGVEPDIEVDNPPEALLRGEDPQLDRAIAEVERQLERMDPFLPERPADPDKTPAQ